MGAMIVAALPLSPPQDGKYWAFVVANDEADPIDAIVVEEVGYEWGDLGNAAPVGTSHGPIAPGAHLEVYREVDTEVRTHLVLRVHQGGRTRRVLAEVGKLYATPSNLEDIPVIERPGKLATLEPA